MPQKKEEFNYLTTAVEAEVEAAVVVALKSRAAAEAEAGGGCCWFLLEATPSKAVEVGVSL